ncbi:Ankyrin repeat domain-containing protein 13C [Tetrabaena socialis]|uniref:Ankyrin repeat domain-containing protein 13C n=1 Tax=Tetrabaena socialis TaxID=47790 RepID=A0A2J8A228_9CHLO|nr:Ankyrin repeat domain-containing protein 13C [Tetrabaena socialis]|eukprot:PNH06555.1 Ankyrin repeat domain-containing protein 13C [Tetrabaena socialis]
MDSDDSFYDAEEGYEELDAPGEVGPARPTLNSEPAAEEPGAEEPCPEPQDPYPLHRAAWYGQAQLVRKLLAGRSKAEMRELDSQGNTALHVAVMRRQVPVVTALLEAGCPAGQRSSRGWVPLMEAVELGDKPLALQLARAEVTQLARAEVAQMRTAVKQKKAALLALLSNGMPDFSLQLKWELGSSMPGVGALVRRVAPNDTYTLWKKVGGGGRLGG